MALEYGAFTLKIREKVGEKAGEGCKVSFAKKEKINEGEADVLVIVPKEGKVKIGPSFRLRELFREYQDGRGIDELAVGIVAIYLESVAYSKKLEHEIQKIGSYERCKEKIYFRLASTERNSHLLGEVPHFEVMDLTMFFYVLMEEEEDTIRGVMLRNSLLSAWGITSEEVRRQAVRNTPVLFPEKKLPLFPLVKEVRQRAKDGEYSAWQEAAWEGEKEPLILTNQKGINGFSVVLYSGVLQEISGRMGQDLYILPSSIHEAVVFPADYGMREVAMQGIVEGLNRMTRAKEDILSYTVYYYSSIDGSLKKIR